MENIDSNNSISTGDQIVIKVQNTHLMVTPMLLSFI
uniref:Carbonic anhydrase 2-like protein n=1 Tax=Mytilus galloprovincialis TaxID=29158 RepID=A0A3S7SXX8_MYTGA|nr:carbonic anhydrase 2-like protein [Mytilus galloprovincialis]